jgi:hypothetical protein
MSGCRFAMVLHKPCPSVTISIRVFALLPANHRLAGYKAFLNETITQNNAGPEHGTWFEDAVRSYGRAIPQHDSKLARDQ